MPDPLTICTVKANGQKYTSWQSITIKRDFSDMISWFQMSCSEGGPLGGSNDSRRLVPGMPVSILLGGKLALTGAVTTRLCSFDANSHDVIIGGRSATTDAPESSMPIHQGDFKGYTAEQAGRAALQPHGVALNVVNPPDTWSKPFPFLAATPGERVGEFLERITKMRGAFLWDDEQGRICVGQGNPAAAVVAELQEGRNILRASVKLSDQGIYSAVNYHGQQPGQGDDMSVRAAQGTATNPGARPSRIRNEHAEMNGDAADMATRAGLEAARSGWDEIEATITVAGWFRPDGLLWGLTDNVSLYSPMGLPNSTGKIQLGIQSVTYAQDGETGTTTTLVLVRPQYLTKTPFADVKSDGSGGYGDAGSSPTSVQPSPPDYQGTPLGQGGIGHA